MVTLDPRTHTGAPVPTRTRAPNHQVPRPGWIALAWGTIASLLVVYLANRGDGHVGRISWYATVVWSLPMVITVQGLVGIVVARRHRHAGHVTSAPPWPDVQDTLVVVLPTVGRRDTLPGLSRVATSLANRLPAHFARVRVDLVVEERCETLAELAELCTNLPGMRLVVVPAHYQTARGTRFKARANQFALELRAQEGEAGADVWVLHMDDDTAVSPPAAAQLADFVRRQRRAGADGRHLAQGVLAYPREYSPTRLTWYADAVRPGCDMSFFAVTTGRGAPRGGLHGELLCVRSSVEAQIGWDFGPDSLVEDAQFALMFCDLYPGGSEWFPAWSEGASPRTLGDFVRQRERWVWGLLRLVADRSVPLLRRLTLLPNLAIWIAAPFGHPFLVLALALLLRDLDTGPALAAMGLLWSLNYGFYVWLYWEGFKVNCRASASIRHRWWEGALVILLMPLSCLLECVGILCGAVRFVTRRRVHFTVIGKPA